MADKHNRTRYLAGCRCDTCKSAQATYVRERRQAKNAEKTKPGHASVRPIARTTQEQAPEPSSGDVVAAVTEELEGLVTASARPGARAVALAMARVLDSPAALAQHPSAAGKLMEVLGELGKGGTRKRSKLAELRSIQSGRSA